MSQAYGKLRRVNVNAWWDAHPEQRYWMEVVTTDSIGTLLQSPKLDTEQWSYDLVAYVRPGDRVLHWDKSSGRESVLRGWSEVVGEAGTVPQYTWQPRGTAGRALGAARTTEGWVAPLGGLHEFRTPPSSKDLQPLRDAIIDLNGELEEKYGALYLPFYLYGKNTRAPERQQLRAQQGYLLKFPAELFDLIPGIAAARIGDDEPSVVVDDAEDLPEDGLAGKPVPKGRTTRAQDPKLRAAIERRSLDVALEYYEGLGATEIKELGKPYDLVVTINGEERHIEVKGSSTRPDTYELTINEIEHARGCPACDLVVVDGIEVHRNVATGDVTASGGALSVWTDWVPEDGALVAKKFAYTLPLK